jgi:hypothetical protein
LIEWLLKELEKNPAGIFHKQDLLKQSKEQFEELKSLKLLTYVQPDLNCETYPCSLPCANSCPMDVVEMDSRLYAICPQNSEIDPISVNRDELDKYQFSIVKFLEQVRSANKLDGSLHEIEQGYFYFGYTTDKGHRVGFVFGFTIARKSALEITGLKCLCADDDFLVVFSPVSMIEDVIHKRELDRERIIQTSFTSSLDFQTYEFSIDKLFSGILKRRAETKLKDWSVKEPSKEAKNVFKKSGDFWLVAYQGSATKAIKNSKGMFYIHRLLGKPDESISAMELANAPFDIKLLNRGNDVRNESINTDLTKQQELVDHGYLEQCQKRLSDIESELAEAEKNRDLATQKRLNKEKEEILNFLKTVTFKGKSTKFTDHREKARLAATNAIKRALTNIKQHNQSLYKHFDNSILRGSDFTYTPDEEINWVL